MSKLETGTPSSHRNESKQPDPPTDRRLKPNATFINPPLSDWQDRAWAWFDEYLKAIIAIAALGAQITFSLIVSDIKDPATLNASLIHHESSPVFQRETVRLLIALSWMFFTFTLGIAVLSSLLFSTLGRGVLADRLGRYIYPPMTFLLNFLPTGAFILLGLATAAYVPVVGWVSVGFLSILSVLILIFWWCGW